MMLSGFNKQQNLKKTFVLIKSLDCLQLQKGSVPQMLKLEPIPKTSEQIIKIDAQANQASVNQSCQKKSLKDDYQKNITINVVKCCIRQIQNPRYQKMLKKRCEKSKVNFINLRKFAQPILKQVVISLGDLKQLLTSGSSQQLRIKQIFRWFLQWYLRHKYINYLIVEGKMNFKERYIEYKNKYMLYLLRMIRIEKSSEQKDIIQTTE